VRPREAGRIAGLFSDCGSAKRGAIRGLYGERKMAACRVRSMRARFSTRQAKQTRDTATRERGELRACFRIAGARSAEKSGALWKRKEAAKRSA